MTHSQTYSICPVCQAKYAPATSFCPLDGTRLHAGTPDQRSLIGTVVGDKYRLTRLLGTGGMAEVYEAEHIYIRKRVALKLLKASLKARPETIARFKREALLVSMISHENVVAVDDFGALEDGTLFMTMELLTGGTLAETLACTDPLAKDDMLDIAIQICNGLVAAHDKGIVHRDMKPRNVALIRGDDGRLRVKILDLGIAKACREAEEDTLTEAGALLGSPQYMSPEQALGKPVDRRTDVYSVGIILYEMATGRRPFTADTPTGALVKHVQEQPAPPRSVAPEREIPEGLEEIILRAIAKSPEDRFATVNELGWALARLRKASQGQAPEAVGATRHAPHPLEVGRVTTAVTPHREEAPVVRPEAIEIASNVFWVSRREGSLLERNTYLIRYTGQGHGLNLIIDPGPPKDLEVIVANTARLVGSARAVDIVFLNHQDPDSSANASFFLEENPEACVICSEDTWRLARFYGLDARRFRAVERFDALTTVLATGHRISFVPTPFCHFRGSVMLYDHSSKVLFSGDLFGGVSRSPELFADESSWEGIRTFHQIYMPDSDALRYAVSRIRRLDPRPEAIAPQHGGVITGDTVGLFLDRLSYLEVGLDPYLASRSTKNYLRAINELLVELEEVVGRDRLRQAVTILKGDASSPNVLTVHDDVVIEIKTEPRSALETLVREIKRDLPADQASEVGPRVVRTLSSWGIDIPDLTLEQALDDSSYFRR